MKLSRRIVESIRQREINQVRAGDLMSELKGLLGHEVVSEEIIEDAIILVVEEPPATPRRLRLVIDREGLGVSVSPEG